MVQRFHRYKQTDTQRHNRRHPIAFIKGLCHISVQRTNGLRAILTPLYKIFQYGREPADINWFRSHTGKLTSVTDSDQRKFH